MLATDAFHGVGTLFSCVILRFVPSMVPVHQGILMRQQLSELQEAKKAATRQKSHERKLVQKAKKRARVKVGEPSQDAVDAAPR
jgi:hypothetical protein